MRLQSRIILLVLPLIVVPLLALGWMAFSMLRDNVLERDLREMRSVGDQIARSATERIDGAVANLRLFAGAPLLNYYLTQPPADRYAVLQLSLLSLFDSYRAVYPDYLEIRLLLPDGREDTRSAPPGLANHREDESGAPYFAPLLASASTRVYSQVYDNPDTGRPALFLGQVLRRVPAGAEPSSEAPQLAGFLALTYDLPMLGQRLPYTPADLGWIAFSNDAGDVLAAAGRLPSPQDWASFRRTPPASEQTAGIDRVTLSGKAYFRLRVPVHPGIELWMGRSVDVVAGAGRQLALAVALTVLAAIVISSGLLLYALKMMVLRRLEALSQAVERFGMQGQSTPLQTGPADEIGQLGHALNAMTEGLQQSRERENFLAYHDNLTGLPNARFVREHLELGLRGVRERGRMVAVLFLNIDQFKRINDSLGYEAGDMLVREIAARLRGVVYGGGEDSSVLDEVNGGLLARWAGDEFIVVADEAHQGHDAERLAGRLLMAFKRPFQIQGEELFASACVGIALYPLDGQQVNHLIKNADLAMDHAKRSGRSSLQFFSASMNTAVQARLQMEKRLRRALEQQRLMVCYQPVVALDSGRITGCEALMRWRDGQLGWVDPEVFIAVAEESELIVPMTEWLLDTVGRQHAQWRDAGLPAPRIAVNISGSHFQRADVAVAVRRALEATGMRPAELELELTETTLVQAPERAIAMLSSLQRLGVQVALDDFGTGYSSLAQLRRFPINRLKIDRSFLRHLPDDPDAAVIVSTILAMARSLKLSVTAEGVESKAQLDFLRGAGCEFGQGFLFQPALAPEILARILARGAQLDIDVANSRQVS